MYSDPSKYVAEVIREINNNFIEPFFKEYRQTNKQTQQNIT